MEAKKYENVTVSEYIKIEQETSTKHEYHDGKIYDMSGGTVEHGLISGNTYGELKFGLRQKNRQCKAINNDVKLYIPSLNKYLYPDVMVICNGIERSEEEHGVINPTVIVEVLSKSTESYDRGDKFYMYRQIESLREYVLINQYKEEVEVFTRQNHLWKITRIIGLDQELVLQSINLSIPMASIYEDITFEKT